MDRTEQTVSHMLAAIEAPLYDVGVLSSRGMLPGLDAIPASAVLEKRSAPRPFRAGVLLRPDFHEGGQGGV